MHPLWDPENTAKVELSDNWMLFWAAIACAVNVFTIFVLVHFS